MRKRVYGLGPTLEANYDNAAASGAADWKLKKVRLYVSGPDGTIGAREFDVTSGAAGTEKALVYHLDHLGSTQSITPWGVGNALAANATGESGRYSEDPWGARRNPFTWTGVPPANTDNGGAQGLTPRGFTGHEMLDDLGFVHMNGRIYDPLLGRFLSADIFVGNPGNLQSFNRYSYVSNNPLTMVDPAGWWEVKLFGFTFGNEGPMLGKQVLSAFKTGNWSDVKQNVGSNANLAGDNLKELGQKVQSDMMTKGPLVVLVEDLGGGLKVPIAPSGPRLATAGAGGATVASEAVTVNTAAVSGTTAVLQQLTKSEVNTGSDGGEVSKEPANTLKENKAKGDAWEKQVVEKELPKTQTDIEKQITIKPNGADTGNVRLDAVGKDAQTGRIKLTDAKASETAPLTKNQGPGYKAIEQNGGTVLGEGKGAYPGGTEIPPTKVDIIRRKPDGTPY